MSIIPYLTMGFLAFVSLLLIFIVLLQRGRGGGLAGALGGAGGQSAFGTKAGDVFTRITVVLAVIWVLLGALNVVLLRSYGEKFGGGSAASTTPVLTAPEKPEGDSKTEASEAGGAAATTGAEKTGAEKTGDSPAKAEAEEKASEKKDESGAAAEKAVDAPKGEAAVEKPAAEEKKADEKQPE